MDCLVVSHKICWPESGSRSGFATDGGFPQQVRAISELFDETRLIVCRSRQESEAGLTPIEGHNLAVTAVNPPIGHGLIRKLSAILWSIRNIGLLWPSVRRAGAIHIPVPGDVGFLALLLSLLDRKRIFVRHCGTWGNRATLADRVLHRLLVRSADNRVVVMATGGGAGPPEPACPSIKWIFATSFSRDEYEAIVPSKPWNRTGPLRLVTVGRLTDDKNARACIDALAMVRDHVKGASLAVVGEGPIRKGLEAIAQDLGLADAVKFYGNVGHQAVLDILISSHVFLFPTRVREGFPKAVLEAMACGLPVLASQVSVLPHLLSDGCGSLLDGTSGDEVAAGILRLCHEPERMAAMGRAARERAREYTLERWRDLICDRLEKAWGRPLQEVDVGQTARRGRAL